MNKFSVNGCGVEIDCLFDSLVDAIKAWEKMGSPTQRGSSVWVTEYRNGDTCETVRTVTIG